METLRREVGESLVSAGFDLTVDSHAPIAVMVFESMEKARAAFDSPAFKEAKKVGDKYAKFRVYAVEGLAQ